MKLALKLWTLKWLIVSAVNGFVVRRVSWLPNSFRGDSQSHRLWSQTTDNDVTEEQVRSMTIRELKRELEAMNVSTKDAFEKEELVKRLVKARNSNINAHTEKYADTGESGKIVRVPILFSYIDKATKVAAENFSEGGGFTIEPGDQAFATIQITVLVDDRSDFQLNLLLDTACSGFVLRPEIVSRYGLRTFDTPVTMTGAGGTTGGVGLSQLNRFRLGDQEFGPLPAAVQDIGALPHSLDGIIGLSFFNQFACMEMDFRNGFVSLFREMVDCPPSKGDFQVVAEGAMQMLGSLGIFTTDVYIGGRGPVKMLVDTGASNSFLSWTGVSDLGLSRDSSFVQPLDGQLGAMGSDNMAMRLTHRINVSSKLELGRPGERTGLSLGGSRRLSLDIGDIPLLDNLASQGVGGILGIDALIKCAVMRTTFKGPRRTITIFDEQQRIR